MKYPFIALSMFIVCAASPVSAQTSIYGLLDIGYGITNGGNAEGAPGRAGKLQQLGNARWTSRWGIKGKEALGNGINIYFQFESSIDPETGHNGGGFDRTAILGLSGDFGSLQLGRQAALLDDTLSAFSITGDPNIAAATYNAGIGSGQRYSRYDSALTYKSPDFSGFTFGVQYVTQNDLASAGVQGAGGDKNLFALALNYSYKKLNIGASIESKPYSGSNIAWGVGASYDFGSFIVSGGYFDSHFKEDGKGVHLGVMVPVRNWELGAQIAYNAKAYTAPETRYAWYPTVVGGVPTGGLSYYTYQTTPKVKPLSWSLFANYDFSRLSTLYFMLNGIDSDAKRFLGAKRKYSIAAGIHRAF